MPIEKRRYAFAHRVIDGFELLTVKRIYQRVDMRKPKNYQIYLIDRSDRAMDKNGGTLIQGKLLNPQPEKRNVSYFISSPPKSKKRYFQSSASFQRNPNGDIQSRTQSHKSYCFQIILKV
ncbi:MAG: hypothetical protein HRT44_03655 [Bdellovibrionales bacterium]|nr:hypothetical protein [Bdellovibrionales bacterium]NQZ18339.1 hypothetical protein [Bdellovibrionales bacterium]